MATDDTSQRISHGKSSFVPPSPYVLRSLLADVPLSADGEDEDVKITCVEFHGKLSKQEIPPEGEALDNASYILASRLPPAFAEPSVAERPGIQQLLLLPSVNKACILCNWTVTFYSLPELSPVFGTAQIRPCNWIGGVDLNALANVEDQPAKAPAVAVLVSLNRKMRVVKIGNEARSLKTIDFSGSITSIRRDSIACVADARAYALLDVDRQLKIPLFPISSLDDTAMSGNSGKVEDISSKSTLPDTSTARKVPGNEERGHGRSTSLGTFMTSSPRPAQRGASADRARSGTPDVLFRESSPVPPSPSARPQQQTQSEASSTPSTSKTESDKPLPDPPPTIVAGQVVPAPRSPPYLKPHLLSPTTEEFLLITGTRDSEPGVGMFVNLEGDVTRSTLEFPIYPIDVVVDGRGYNVDTTPANMDEDEEGYVLATMRQNGSTVIEIQRWDVEPSESHLHRSILALPGASEVGIRSVVGRSKLYFTEVAANLQLKRFQTFLPSTKRSSVPTLRSVDSRTDLSLQRVTAEQELFEPEGLPEGWEEAKAAEEKKFASRLGHASTRLVAWSKKDIWWIVRNPLASQMADQVTQLYDVTCDPASVFPPLDRRRAIEILNSLRGHEAQSETAFLSLVYTRQVIGLLLFASFLHESDSPMSKDDAQAAEEALLDGALDPRVVMSIVPVLREEILEGKTGIWLHAGVREVATSLVRRLEMHSQASRTENPPSHVMVFLKQFLTAWRRRKGFGSVSSEGEVFRSVDAALLVVLLQLDKKTPMGPARSNSIRAELNELVDGGLDCFDRAILLLEANHRLYILSRLYQSRKMAGDVLGTWRRIMIGEHDAGGEFRDGEQRLKDYLLKIRTPTLFVQYGVWLAERNPKLGVQIFAEDRAQVRFDTTQVIDLLRQGAPAAVKDYLEYLVFHKGRTEYVNELVVYYLDMVTGELAENETSREMLKHSYDSYRALRPPKPTYAQFIADNSLRQDWWLGRSRLLHLLGGHHNSAVNYDVDSILARIEPFKDELVAERIILRGRQAHHKEALQLLTHGLGDYDTAINYCLLGGPSMSDPTSGTVSREDVPSQAEQTELFNILLVEFLRIRDVSNRVEQTSVLLERFGGWFDVQQVLSLIPDSWSIELVSSFLLRALRRMVRDRSEAMVARSLSAAENLQISADLLEGIAAGRAVLVPARDQDSH